jgi:putative cofactor-binding repeat protein
MLLEFSAYKGYSSIMGNVVRGSNIGINLAES